MSFTEIMRESLDALELEEEDQAASELAMIYAESIELARTEGNRRALIDLGPKLTTLLAELLMTPKARGALKRTAQEVDADDSDASEFDDFRS